MYRNPRHAHRYCKKIRLGTVLHAEAAIDFARIMRALLSFDSAVQTHAVKDIPVTAHNVVATGVQRIVVEAFSVENDVRVRQKFMVAVGLRIKLIVCAVVINERTAEHETCLVSLANSIEIFLLTPLPYKSVSRAGGISTPTAGHMLKKDARKHPLTLRAAPEASEAGRAYGHPWLSNQW